MSIKYTPRESFNNMNYTAVFVVVVVVIIIVVVVVVVAVAKTRIFYGPGLINVILNPVS